MSKLTLDFYRPHKPVYAPTKVRNPKTGKIEVPLDRTKQSELAASDINNIIKSFTQSGQFNRLFENANRGVYVDLPQSLDYQEAQNLRIQAENAFMSLPAKVRERFNNLPHEFLAFMENPANRDEARELGLLRPEAASPPPGGPPKEPPPAAAAAAEPPKK